MCDSIINETSMKTQLIASVQQEIVEEILDCQRQKLTQLRQSNNLKQSK
jgi:hypothetical protein